jgi:hypothetical protein
MTLTNEQSRGLYGSIIIVLGAACAVAFAFALDTESEPRTRVYCAKDTDACFATCARAGLALYEAMSAVGLYECPRREPLACHCVDRTTTNERRDEETSR